MPTQTYDFAVPSEYTLSNTDLAGGIAALAAGATSGTVFGNTFFRGVRISSFTASETPNGGTIKYGLEIDTVLKWHDGVDWVASNGTSAQLNTLAQVQANLLTALNASSPLVKPYVYLERALASDPSPTVDDLVFEYLVVLPNQQTVLATDTNVALDTGVGGVASPGETRVTLDPTQITYRPGTNELFVFQNGLLQVIDLAYVEEDSAHVVFTSLLDAIGPTIDTVEFRVSRQGAPSSASIVAPTYLEQVSPPTRPDNFGGSFEFS